MDPPNLNCLHCVAVGLHFLKRTLRLKFDKWNWYQSLIDASKIWGVEQADTWNPEMCEIEIKPYLMGLIFGVWIKQTQVVPK